MVDETDGLAELADVLAIRRAGWHRHVNEESGATALFPIQAKDEREWERRCTLMHAAQEIITVEPKPLANYADHIRELRRGN